MPAKHYAWIGSAEKAGTIEKIVSFKRIARVAPVDEHGANAGLRAQLVDDVAKLPGSRLLDGRFTAVQQSIGTPKERVAGTQYLRAFVEDVKASGLMARIFEENRVRGVSVAAAAPRR